MLFTSYALFFSILLFVTLYVAAKWCFKKSWLNNILLVGGNILILTQIVSWKSLFLLSLLSLLAYGVGLLLRKRKSRTIDWYSALSVFHCPVVSS